jgi:sugar O-acyltransferase (sialic acid O-acetyltransferase NeuD family)
VNRLVAVYGAGGFGREVMPLVRSSIAASGEQYSEGIFIDDSFGGKVINGHRVLTFSELIVERGAVSGVVLAVADPRVRERLDRSCRMAGLAIASVRAANAQVFDDVVFGEGAVICPFVTLSSNIRIGRCFHANLYSYVAHDCRIGDYVTFAPSVTCCGNVWIEDFAYVGAGAVIRQGTPGEPLVIGKGAVIGMGAVVIKSVPPGAVVAGNPARLLRV